MLNAKDLQSPDCDYRFVDVEIETDSGRTLVMQTLFDAIRVHGIRLPVTAVAMQEIADELECMLPTQRLADHRFIAARRGGTHMVPAWGAWKMKPKQYSSIIDGKIRDRLGVGMNNTLDPMWLGQLYNMIKTPLDTVGKSWVLTRLNGTGEYASKTAYNYGWHFKSSPSLGVPEFRPATKIDGFVVAQGLGGRHNYAHWDCSQVCAALFKRSAKIYDQRCVPMSIDIGDVLSGRVVDKEVLNIISSEGIMPDRLA